MGLVRLFLATLVLASHTGFVDVGFGVLAVEIFFVISGFYMAMLITERFAFQKNGVINFYKSRTIKIYIPYYFALLLMAPLQILLFKKVDLSTSPISIFSNLFIFGQDLIKFLRVTEGCGYKLFNSLFVGQAWSVAIELIFYAIAPFLLTRFRVLIAVLIVSGLAKIGFLIYYHKFIAVTWGTAYCADALIDGILPLELSLFCLGAVGYYFYKSKLRDLPITKKTELKSVLLVFAAIVAILATLHKTPINFIKELPLFYLYSLVIMLLVPLIFWLTNKNFLDRFLGDTSYIFYLIHGIPIAFMNHFTPEIIDSRKFFFCLIATLLASIFFTHFIEEKINNFRRKKYG